MPPRASATPARADQAAGEAVFQKYCQVCHTTEARKNKIGPTLAGILGRKAGTAPGYSYSDANKNSGVIWNEKTLDTYLTDDLKKFAGAITTSWALPGSEPAPVAAPPHRSDLVLHCEQSRRFGPL